MQALAILLAASQSTAFVDRTGELGLEIGMGAACWVDLDRDGWTDLVAGGFVWRNEQGKRFSKLAQVGDAVAADFDNDGFPDLYSWSRGMLFRNEKGKSFAEFPLPADFATVSRGACWGDWNADGFVDLYVGGYENWETQTTYPSFILMNEKGKSFRIARRESKYRTRGVTACDFDADGDLDVYASNYRLQPNQLWQNDGKGAFVDAAPKTGVLATSTGFEGGHSIGSVWGDFDADGNFDLFAGNFAHVDSRGDQPKSRFYRNLGKVGDYRFEDKGTCGVFYQESYASPSAGDFDNDGRLDLYFTTVYATASFGRKNYPVLFHNRGDFVFADATAGTGLEQLPATYQAAWADFDRDGKLDLATGGKIFANRSASGNWLGLRLQGDGKRANRSAIGTQVRIKADGSTLSRQVEAGTGEGNQNDLTLHFGLGSHKGRVDLDIIWPDGKRQTVRRVETGRIVDLRR